VRSDLTRRAPRFLDAPEPPPRRAARDRAEAGPWRKSKFVCVAPPAPDAALICHNAAQHKVSMMGVEAFLTTPTFMFPAAFPPAALLAAHLVRCPFPARGLRP